MSEEHKEIQADALHKLLKIAREERDHWKGRAVKAEEIVERMQEAIARSSIERIIP